jgi:cell wall-associated NlpC family hydrolase
MRVLSSFAVLLLAACATTPHDPAPTIPLHGVIGIKDAHLDPAFWTQRQPHAERVILDETAITAQNAKLVRIDGSMNDLEAMPPQLPAAQVRAWIEELSRRPTHTLYDETGREVAADTLDDLVAALNVDDVPLVQHTRYGMVVRRADLRTFPTRMRVFNSPDDGDIDRFQESALFPGTPVVIAHTSNDGEWLFVISPRYEAWIEKQYVAEGRSEEIFAYTRKAPYLIVTGSTVRTVYTREQAAVSDLQLDMGVRVPLLTSWPANEPVNGQHAYAAHVIELPIRGDDGALGFSPALLPRTADVATRYLPFTAENLVQQSFKFLGERYGWGHSYNARDCSGFVSEIYRSFGIALPRNTRDQGLSRAFDRIELTTDDTHEERLAILETLQVGDLIYIPGHVMMVIGYDNGMPYVIHDTTGISYRNESGIARVPLNGVSVTPLTPLLVGEGRSIVDRIYSIQRIR